MPGFVTAEGANVRCGQEPLAKAAWIFFSMACYRQMNEVEDSSLREAAHVVIKLRRGRKR